jgi:small-conductance mechanosensitive channel
MNWSEIFTNLKEYFTIINPVLEYKINFINISLGTILLIVIVTLVVLQIVKFVKFKLLTEVTKYAKNKNIKILDLVVEQINKVGNPFFIASTLYVVSILFNLKEVRDNIFFPIFVIVCGYYSISIIKSLLTWLVTASLANPNATPEEKKDIAFVQLVQTFVGIFTWVFVFISVSQILGWNISAVLSVLGVSSIAVAFALQNILADVFAAFTIYIDQPFKPGDQIMLSEYTGTVKKIGLKSTRISLLDGDELIVSNRDLTSARVRNLRKISARRVSTHILIDHAMSSEKLKLARSLIIDAINLNEEVQLRRVNLSKILGTGKEIQFVYLIEDEEYEVFCRIQEEINFRIIEGFEENQIKFAIVT